MKRDSSEEKIQATDAEVLMFLVNVTCWSNKLCCVDLVYLDRSAGIISENQSFFWSCWYSSTAEAENTQGQVNRLNLKHHVWNIMEVYLHGMNMDSM